MTILTQIQRFLQQTGMPETVFGRLAASDPRLVSDIRNGREPRRAMTGKITHFIKAMHDYRHPPARTHPPD